VKISLAIRSGCRIEKKGKDRTGQSKKSQSGNICNISPILGEAPTVLIETKICTAGNLADVITYAKFKYDIFRGYDFIGGGQISHFPIVFAWALQQCSATTLPVIHTGNIHIAKKHEHQTVHRNSYDV